MLNWLRDWKIKIASFNRNIRLFMLANMLIQTGMGIFAVMYNLYIKELGFPETVNGTVISMTSLATAIILIPAGFLSDRYGRKGMIILGTIVSVLTLFYRSVTISEQSIIYAAFLTGLFMALVQVSGVPFLAENSRASERMHLFSIHFSLVTIASVIGSLGGGVLADALHLYANMSVLISIKWVLIIGSFIFGLGLIPLFQLKPSEKVEETVRGTDAKTKEIPSNFKRNITVIVLFGFANLLIGTGSGLVIPYLNLYFSNRFDASNAYVGLILSLGSAMTAVAMLLGPALVKRVGHVRALVIFQLLSIPFLFITGYTNSLIIASLGFLLRQALMNAGNPIQSAIAMDLVHDKYKGLANSVNQMVFHIGWASTGGIATGLVMAYGFYWGYAYTFSITGVLYIIASTYFYILFGRKKLGSA
ncbi:MFS transporter [Psychrobacillus lasiicapitis]|uniref:MFS transporter n=1 Tax=Psychrobacillus lasiicapitis TaxID=1636719 RepID=A0A544SV83_9BACI|nr:MFS transporter [Psychrobacillus lasiicapitis]TQR09116.1 MFS transporter [Psychrobacillus lasiicapitis]GGA47631.1 MFS transporter [Psychrobacillus lasiicapitis]